jgi:hypothetical protein
MAINPRDGAPKRTQKDVPAHNGMKHTVMTLDGPLTLTGFSRTQSGRLSDGHALNNSPLGKVNGGECVTPLKPSQEP